MQQAQSLMPDALIDLYEIDFTNLQVNFDLLFDMYGISFGGEAVYRFCPMINDGNPIIWQGKSYQPLPIKVEDFEVKSDGRLPRPKIVIANPDGLFSKIAHSNHDFANAQVTRKRTFARFLDDENFLNDTNPYESSDFEAHFPDDIYYISRKTEENKKFIKFELVSALELEETFIPARVILPSYCGFTYRCSVGCGYTGLPIETSSGKSLIKDFAHEKPLTGTKEAFGFVNPDEYVNGISSVKEWNRLGRNPDDGSEEYLLNDIIRITPSKSNNPYKNTPQIFVCIQSHTKPASHHPFFSPSYWLKDECQKNLEACKKRFSEKNTTIDLSLKETGYNISSYNQANSETLLKFGGFPGTHKFDVASG